MADEQEGTTPDETAATAGGSEARTRRSMPRRRVAMAEPDEAPRGSSAVSGSADRSGDAALAAAESPRRTGPVRFVRESIAELRKVIWPTPWQWQQYFIVVLVFVLFIIAFVSLIDLGLATAIIRAFG